MALYKTKRGTGFDKRALREGLVNVTKSKHVTKKKLFEKELLCIHDLTSQNLRLDLS